MFKHILIPTDGSENAGKAIEAGLRLARENGAKVTCYYGIESMYMHHMGAYASKAVMDELDRRTQEIADKVVGEVAALAKAQGITVEVRVSRVGAPHQGIIEAAKAGDCDLILLGSHGRGALTSLMLGSVTQKVLANSTIPVLVYR